MDCILNISCDYSPENLLLKSNNFPLLTIFSFHHVDNVLILLSGITHWSLLEEKGLPSRTMVCSVIEVRFESALYSWVDNLMLIVLGILSLPKCIKEY